MNIDQLAYLKSPQKIRAALINAGKPAPSIEVIERRLAKKSPAIRVADPLPSDGVEYRVPKVKAEVAEGCDVYMRAYHFPKAVENLKRKMRALQDEAAALSENEALACLRAANEAWDREVEIARLQQRICREGGE